MYDHNSSVFNNNCLKTPKTSKNDHPQTLYDQKYLNELHNEVTKTLNEKMKAKILESGESDIKTFIDFYDSIPEYDEINHLSNREFYKKLENLKEKQKHFCEYLKNQLKIENKDTQWIEDYQHLNIGEKGLLTLKKKKPSIKPFCATSMSTKISALDKHLDDEFLSFSDKEVLNKPPSRRSVRIETPSSKSSPDLTPGPYFRAKSRAQIISPADTRSNPNTDWEDLMMDDFYSNRNTPRPTEVKSAPSSPTRTRRLVESDGITIPKPFQMTVRDEENKIVEELFLKINKPKDEKQEQFKAHDVPIESQIPLFDKIMEDRYRRSQMVKEKRKAALQAQMKPFSFTRRDEEIQELTRKFSKSLPCVYNDEMPLKIKKFKAKPIPKSLFSNYVYRKMHEDEFYRALQKKVRAEEMLKHASLPPSMAKREKSKPKIDVCPRSFRNLESAEEREGPMSKKSKKIPNFQAYHDKYERELEELKNEFISTSPRPFRLKASKRERRNKKHCCRSSSATSKSSSEMRTSSSLEFSSINRSNLAALLRIQSARRRSDMEMTKKLEEAKLKEEARWREKIMRKKPVWQSLAYSHEEDLAMRLQLRRDEEKLRNEEHRLRMQLMLGRVNQQPTLFERQSQTKEELIEQLHKEYQATAKRSFSDLSDIKSLADVKDEASQAMLEGNLNDFNKNNSRRNSKEEGSSGEEKEQCDCSSEDIN